MKRNERGGQEEKKRKEDDAFKECYNMDLPTDNWNKQVLTLSHHSNLMGGKTLCIRCVSNPQ